MTPLGLYIPGTSPLHRLPPGWKVLGLLVVITGILLADNPWQLAAAGLVVWIAVRRGEPEPRRYRFEVVQAASLDGIDPLARALAESLNGGASPPGGVR